MDWMTLISDLDSAATSNAVDLSRLPAPQVVAIPDFELIVAEMKVHISSELPDVDFNLESDPVVKLIELFAWRETVLRQNFNERATSIMLAFATGGDLDNIGANFGVERLVIVEAEPENQIEQELESDDAFLRRILLAPESYSVAGPASAYIYHALSAHPEALDASATSPDPGEVIVSMLGRQGDGTASSELIEAVEERVNNREVRPLTDLVTVQSAVIIEFTIDATITFYSGPDPDIVLDAAQAALDSYLAINRRIGRDITRSGIFAALHREGVQRVDLVEPSDDIVVDRLSAAYCTDIAIASGGIDD